jgi:hypothetical protein
MSDWISAKERLPKSEDLVLVIANGKPTKNTTLYEAYELATYYEGEGWCLDMWPTWEGADVTHWMPLPDPPEVP